MSSSSLSSLTFCGPANVPFCFAHQRASRTPVATDIGIDGDELVVTGKFPQGRGDCQGPITARFAFRLSDTPNGRSVDYSDAKIRVTRVEEDIFDPTRTVEGDARLAPGMVTDFVQSVVGAVRERLAPNRHDSDVPDVPVDAPSFHSHLTSLAVAHSDLSRQGKPVPISVVEPAQVPVHIGPRRSPLTLA